GDLGEAFLGWCPEALAEHGRVDPRDPAEPGEDELRLGLCRGEPLLARHGGGGGEVARRRSLVHPAMTGSRLAAEGVRARADAEVVGAVPVAQVVPAFVARTREARDLVTEEAGRLEPDHGELGHRGLLVLADG